MSILLLESEDDEPEEQPKPLWTREDFASEQGMVNFVRHEQRGEMMSNDPGYRSCRCEDYPCCGH